MQKGSSFYVANEDVKDCFDDDGKIQRTGMQNA